MLHKLLRMLLVRSNVTYDDTFFRDQWFRGWEELAPVLAALIAERPDWRRVLDFGCGPGAMIDPMRAAGVEYVGCDYSAEARALYLKHFGAHPEAYVTSLEDIEPAHFDVFLSFDVFEHMTDAEISAVLDATRATPTCFLNISRDWRTPGHVNVKSDRAWLRFFARHGLAPDEATTTHLRAKYRALRPGAPDRWDHNMFVLTRTAAKARQGS